MTKIKELLELLELNWFNNESNEEENIFYTKSISITQNNHFDIVIDIWQDATDPKDVIYMGYSFYLEGENIPDFLINGRESIEGIKLTMDTVVDIEQSFQHMRDLIWKIKKTGFDVKGKDYGKENIYSDVLNKIDFYSNLIYLDTYIVKSIKESDTELELKTYTDTIAVLLFKYEDNKIIITDKEWKKDTTIEVNSWENVWEIIVSILEDSELLSVERLSKCRLGNYSEIV